MRRPSLLWSGAIITIALLAAPVRADEPLSLEEAVSIALRAEDPAVVRHSERAAALDDRAVADSQLPDPQLKLGLRNLPTNSFDFTQEPMTQAQIGIQQSFPAGDTLSLTREKRSAEADAARASRRLEALNLALETRLAWLEAFYWMSAKETINASRDAVRELITVITATFATGRQLGQDIFRAELETSLLDDRLVDAERKEKMARAVLTRYIDAVEAARPLPRTLPVLSAPATGPVLRDRLVRHPAIAVEDARIMARAREIDIAREQYEPQWMLDVGYGVRGGSRADFASVGVTLSLPFFTGKRQDRRVSAARHERGAARLDRQTRLLELKKFLDRTYADWEKLGQRVALYERAVLERAAATTEATLAAYRNRVSDFNDLIQARLAELDAELKLLRLEVDRAQAQARLLYLDGEYNE